MRIGVPTEIKEMENRVGATPAKRHPPDLRRGAHRRAKLQGPPRGAQGARAPRERQQGRAGGAHRGAATG